MWSRCSVLTGQEYPGEDVWLLSQSTLGHRLGWVSQLAFRWLEFPGWVTSSRLLESGGDGGGTHRAFLAVVLHGGTDTLAMKTQTKSLTQKGIEDSREPIPSLWSGPDLLMSWEPCRPVST